MNFEGPAVKNESSNEDDKIKNEIEKILEANKFQQENGRYYFFEYQKDRVELASYCRKIVEYLHDNKISDLVIIDRSSRPVYIGVMEYWRKKYPNEKMPGIYFMNPKGFKSREALTEEELEEVQEDCNYKHDLDESSSQARSEAEIIKELEETYFNLVKDKDKTILIFDSCIHSGNTLAPLKEILEKAGFTDLRIGAINRSDRGSLVKTDFSITSDRPNKGCYPFDRDRMIEKTFDHVYSKKSRDPRSVALAIMLRREIKHIIDESIENKEN
jgi:hypothetical protein